MSGVLYFFALFLSAISTFANVTEEEAILWGRSGVSIAYMNEHYVNDKECHKNQTNLLGCVRALSTLSVLLESQDETKDKTVDDFKNYSFDARLRVFENSNNSINKKAQAAGVGINSFIVAARDAHGYVVPTDLHLVRTGSIKQVPQKQRPAQPDVRGQILTGTNQKKWIYIKIDSFSRDGTCEGFRSEYLRAAKQARFRALGLMLDVRNNLGGSVDETGCILGSMIGNFKEYLTIRDPATNELIKENSSYTTMISGLKIDIPIVVIVNSQSASASEILAGAIQDEERGWIVGERTYGKGTVQDRFTTPLPNLAAFKTVGRFHFRSGWSNQRTGILPDFTVISDTNTLRREVDKYPNTVAGFNRPPGVRAPSPSLHECVSKNERTLNTADAQLQKAAAVLSCM